MVRALKKLQDCTIPEKIAVLFRSPDLFLRNAAVDILASQWQAPLEILARSLKSEDKHVRKLALDALYALNNPIVTDIIASALDDDDVNNLIAAVEYIADRQGYRYADRIADVLARAQDPFLVSACLEALGKIGNQYTKSVVQELFPDPASLPEYLIPSYLRFLAGCGSGEYLSLVLDIAFRWGKVFYKEILDVIRGIIQRTDTLSEGDQKAMGSCLRILLDSDIPSANKYEVLFLLVQGDRDNCLQDVRMFLESEDPLLRLAALEVIGEYRLQECIPEVQALLEKEVDEDVKQCALDALRKLGVEPQ
ncbi:MAG: HEAT repeat domain-containing protein [Atribacterota bacterium]